MIFKRNFVVAFILGTSMTTIAQSDGGIFNFHDQYERPAVKKIIRIPDVKDYKVLKGDFHIHTIFSDGEVLPKIRVQEALLDGLDVMAITDHVEGRQRYSAFVKSTSHLQSYDQAKDLAAANNLILIKGVEISRKTPPGHFNALYVGDPSKYITTSDHSTDREAVMTVANQKAFIMWNHPGWRADSHPGSYEWIGFVDSLYKSKALQGIEVVNAFGIHKKALDWAIDKGLTVIGNSDIHSVTAYRYNFSAEFTYRPMTLILAKEKTAAAVREALEAGRTIAWASRYFAGKEENLRDLFAACVQLSPAYYANNSENYYEITNSSDLYFELKLNAGEGTEKLILYPSSSQVIKTKAGQKRIKYEVSNTFVRSDKHLVVEFALTQP